MSRLCYMCSESNKEVIRPGEENEKPLWWTKSTHPDKYFCSVECLKKFEKV